MLKTWRFFSVMQSNNPKTWKEAAPKPPNPKLVEFKRKAGDIVAEADSTSVLPSPPAGRSEQLEA